MKNSGMSLIPFSFSGYKQLEFHRSLLQDTVRTESFRKAISKVVKKGDVVVDLGAGTGILSFFAYRAGAKRIYAIEGRPIIGVARRIARGNKMLRKIIFLNSNSRAVYLPEKADVIISECIGYYVLGGDMISAVVQIRDRFLKKGGGVIPRSISMFLAPVSSPTHSKYLNFWSKKLLYGINFSPVQEMVRNNVYSTIMDKADLIAGPKKIYTIDLSRDTPNEMFSATADFLISRSGYMNGVCGWFDVDLCNGINFSTSPYGKPTVWRQAFFPIDETPVKKYDTARVDLILKRTGDDSCSCFSWSIKIISSQGARRRIVRQYSTKMSFPFNHRKICSQKRCDLNIGGQERNKSLEENARRSEIIQKYFAYSSK